MSEGTEPMTGPMKRRRVWVLLGTGLLGAWALSGCSKNAGGGSSGGGAAPSPAHPAMRTAPTGASNSSSSSSGSAGLPQGHPPIQSRASGQSPPAASGGTVNAADLVAQLARFGMSVTFPEGWILERGSSMRLATVRLPRAEGDTTDGEMSIIPARGSVDANVRRWEGQFKEKPSAKVSTRAVEGGLEVTVVEIDGTFTAGGGPMMGGGTPQPNTKMLGAIVETPGKGEMVFFKGWGPAATMEKWRASFEAFVASIHVPR